MKKFSVIMLFVAGIAATACGQKPNTLSETEIHEGWTLLFDGTSLEGWRNFKSEELTGWQVVDGAIQADGSGSDASGYIVTKKEYENFHLSVDWRLTEGGNSGLLYHVVERREFDVPYVTGPEYQLIDKAGWEAANAPTKLEEWQSLGVDYAMHTRSRRRGDQPARKVEQLRNHLRQRPRRIPPQRC